MRGDRLKRLRTERKLTQKQLGKIINVTKVSISGYEKGSRTPDTDNLGRLADFFNVTTDYLLGRSNDPDLTAKQERLIDKETEEILELLDKLPKDMKKHYLELFKAHTENSEHARDKN